MPYDKQRQEIAFEAARMLYQQFETDFGRAKRKAARRVTGVRVRPRDLPSDSEVRAQFDFFTRTYGEAPVAGRPSTGDARPLAADGAGGASEPDECDDRFDRYRTLLQPLEHVSQHRDAHPEGDALYHSLQVYHFAVQELPYDEEFLLAALLHDVGKALDPYDHVRAGLEALAGSITERTAWLIEHHPAGRQWLDGTLGVRARRRLEEAPDFEELILLARCDRAGRVYGLQVPDLDAALNAIRTLAKLYG